MYTCFVHIIAHTHTHAHRNPRSPIPELCRTFYLVWKEFGPLPRSLGALRHDATDRAAAQPQRRPPAQDAANAGANHNNRFWVLLLLMVEIRHDLIYQNSRIYGSIICVGWCRISIISGSRLQIYVIRTPPHLMPQGRHEGHSCCSPGPLLNDTWLQSVLRP